jgi:hypothetical protein
MLFSFSRGSTGSGSKHFKLYIPFTIAPGGEISALEKSKLFKIEGYDITLEKSKTVYMLTIGIFTTIEEAKSFFLNLKAFFPWASLKFLKGIVYPKSLSDLNLFEKPIIIREGSIIKPLCDIAGWEVVEGTYDATHAVIIPDWKKLVRNEMGIVTVTGGIGPNNFAECIEEALQFPLLEKVVNEEKLILALDLYSSSFFQMTDNARLITLVTSLEALTPEFEVSVIAKTTLNSLKIIAKKERDQYEKSGLEYESINHLLSRIGNLKKEAIGTSMRRYILKINEEHSELGDPEGISTKLKMIYNVRSKLLHEGFVPQKDVVNGINFLNNFIPELLKTMFINYATNDQNSS